MQGKEGRGLRSLVPPRARVVTRVYACLFFVSAGTKCPRGTYRYGSRSMRRNECRKCPRGRYGETEGLESSSCTAACPTGRYNDLLGAKTEDDCKYCPPGVYGQTTGLETRYCTAPCPDGTYSSEFGLVSPTQCNDCPTGYRGWQCTWTLTPRRSSFTSADGLINEGDDASGLFNTHAYIDGGAIPQGSSPVSYDNLGSPLINNQNLR